MAKKSGARKKKRTQVPDGAGATAPDGSKVPKSLVMRRGKTSAEVGDLVTDLRMMMLPYTALHFQEDAKNRKLTLQQYAKHVALPMGITHILSFSQNDNRLNLRVGRTPEGPTLHFRVDKFSLSKDIKNLQKRPVSFTSGLQSNPPVVVTNNFGDSSNKNSSAQAPPHVKLMRITFQNLVPAINVATVNLNQCRRVVLFNLIPPENDENEEGSDTPIVEMRHYAIQASAVGVHRRVKKLTSSSKRKLPNLHKVNDIADYVTGQSGMGGGGSVASDAAPSDSEAEDDPRHTLELPDSYMGSAKSQQAALKLVEIGPRLSLSLVKVEKGLGQGEVLYHAHVKKSAEEVAELKAKQEREASLKQQRRATQQANVEKKRKAAEEKRETKRKRKEERQEAILQSLREGGAQEGQPNDDSGDDSDGS